jgi:acylphosphatase
VTVARRAVVHGRVQGVFFRETTRRRASAAAVSGWVRNNPDVEVVLDFLGRGPSGAVVERVEVDEREPDGLSGFEIR